jgi:hypothetical protein
MATRKKRTSSDVDAFTTRSVSASLSCPWAMTSTACSLGSHRQPAVLEVHAGLRAVSTKNERTAKITTRRPIADKLIWYARVLPPPLAGLEEHVVFTTPYVLVEPGEREWLA